MEPGVSTAIIYAVAEPDDIKAGPRGRFEKVGAGAMSDREQELLMDFRRARRLSRLRAVHVALRAREPRQGQAVRRQAVARTGRAVSHRRSVPVLLQPDLRARIHLELRPPP